MRKTLLVDLNNVLWRVFSTTPDIPQNAIVHIARWAHKFEVDHIFVAQDAGVPAYRKLLLFDYKSAPLTGEQKEELTKFHKFREKAEKELRELYVTIQLDGFEADDIVAFLAKGLPGEKVIISTDKDYLQLVSEEVSVVLQRKVYTPVEFKERFGFGPEKFVLYRALVGDESDNIKGVRGIGDVTAKKLLQKVNSVDELIEYSRQSNKKIEQRVAEQREVLVRSMAVIQLPAPNIKARLGEGSLVLPYLKGRSSLATLQDWTKSEVKNNLADVVNAEVIEDVAE
jgi:DNA polymerase-1